MEEIITEEVIDRVSRWIIDYDCSMEDVESVLEKNVPNWHALDPSTRKAIVEIGKASKDTSFIPVQHRIDDVVDIIDALSDKGFKPPSIGFRKVFRHVRKIKRFLRRIF